MGRTVAVAGATGAVGQEMLRVLEARDYPLDRLKVLASERSRGKTLMFRDEPYTVEVLADDSFKDVDIRVEKEPTFLLLNTSDFEVETVQVPENVNLFVSANGSRTQNISFRDHGKRLVETMVSRDDRIPQDAISLQ